MEQKEKMERETIKATNYAFSRAVDLNLRTRTLSRAWLIEKLKTNYLAFKAFLQKSLFKTSGRITNDISPNAYSPFLIKSMALFAVKSLQGKKQWQ